MNEATDISPKAYSQIEEGYPTEISPIERKDLKDLSKRFNQITISGYDCVTELDNNGLTFEEVIQNCATPPTCIKFIDPKKKGGDILPKTLPHFSAIEAIDISECGLREIPPILLQIKQLKVLKASYNHIHSLPEQWGHLDIIALDISENLFDEVSLTINRLENLEILVMDHCNLKKFPDHVLELKKLRCLVLDNNPLGPVTFETLQSTSLESISLKGCLIPEMSRLQFSNLRFIDIRSNSIQAFPVDLTREINVLKLSGNEIDTVPEEISLLKRLTELKISSCGIKQFPGAVLTLKTLQSLDISNNFIRNIPPDISKLKLRKLCIAGNPLDDFPTFIDELQDLEKIDLSSSFLEKIPSVTEKLRKLKVNDNCLAELPDVLCQKNLEKLEINENPVKQLPDSFRHALNLRCLDISSTDLQEIPPQILHLSRLERLSMTNCALESLPSDWQKCLNISYLDLSKNPLFSLPQSILQLCKLEELYLKSCCLLEFPDNLLQMRRLHTLNLEQNLIAELPKDFRSMNLKTLNVRDNLLPQLPDSLKTNTRLSELNIAANKIKEFPSVIFELQNLRHLFLDDNCMCVLPQYWLGLDIFLLSLKNNPLEKVDNMLDDLQYMTQLYLGNCLLTEIPPNFSSFIRMSTLDISDNNITSVTLNDLPPNLISLTLDNNPLGTVPESVQQVTKLNELSINSCGLKDLPSFICWANRLEKLFVAHNCLGRLPVELKDTMLIELHVGWNPWKNLDFLHGQRRLRTLNARECQLEVFPRTVLDLPKLTQLDLRCNAIHFLPDDMFHSNLTELFLFGNAIKAIPDTIVNLGNLRKLVLNELQEFPQALLQMSNLVELNLLGCQDRFMTLPASWEKAKNLQTLSCFCCCHFLSIGSLGKLVDIDIEWSKDTISTEVCQSRFLKRIQMSFYFLRSNYSPPTFDNVLLKNLDICNYKFAHLPDTLAKLTRLEELHIWQTNLKVFPDELSVGLKKLQVLKIRENVLATLPKEWVCRRLVDLDVSQVPLDAWYDVIPQLPNITKLAVSRCNILAFPVVLLQLNKLQELDVSNNHITDLPVDWHSTRIKVLNMADNSLGRGSTLHVVSNLPSLQTLDLSGNSLDTFPTAIQDLKYLRNLNISSNSLDEFPESMQTIQTLETFTASSCGLRKVPSFLLKLRKIKEIKLDGNGIKEIPNDWSSRLLLELNLANNKELHISSDTLSGIGRLEQLILSSCGLTEIPALVLHMPVLSILDLANNPITKIPEEVHRSITRIGEVKLNTSNLIEPPKEIYEGSRECIEQYYTELKTSKACKVGFHNIILLGSTKAGKTSLIKSLVNGESTLTKLEDRTIAADEETWELMENLHFHIIDFGGHDVYELTYPIFLKERKGSIIIAVDLSKISPENVEKSLFKWLHTVLSMAGNSSDIIVAGTKGDLCDDAPRRINFLRKSIEQWIEQMLDQADRLLSSEEPFEGQTQIEHFKEMAVQEIRTVATSSLSMSGLDKLKKILLGNSRENIAKLPGAWYDLYESITRLKGQRHFEGFYKVSQLPRISSQPMTSVSMQTCLRYMHQRGMILWYGNDSTLKEYVFYDIAFILAALKKLLAHDMESTFKTKLLKPFFNTMDEQQIAVEMFRETGMASQQLLKCLWHNFADTNEIYNVCLRILKLFRLCYETNPDLLETPTIGHQVAVQSNEKIFYFPCFVQNAININLNQLWPQKVPLNYIPIRCTFTFEYSVPISLFEQFSVQLQSLLAKGHRRKDWKNTIYVKQDAVQLIIKRIDDKANSMASIVVEMRSKIENASQMYKLCVSVVKTIQTLRKVFTGILYNEVYVCPHCILTDADAPHSIPLDDALQVMPRGTKHVYCKKDDSMEVPAALHYPQLLGKIKTTSHNSNNSGSNQA